ncbi:ATP-NAD kinase family protein [Leifsonia sp. NPDC058292]|uniref:ATP-NAD kinase family protein n=1 Tax=Leifsonia sp. NPDC058292 TaxID=3346428 RepID=UPI0036DF762B
MHAPGQTIGFLLNPVAGVGGPAGLVGSDGAEVQREAAARGAVPRAAARAAAALAVIARSHPQLEVITAAGALGEDAVRAAGLTPRVVYAAHGAGRGTTGDDTRRATVALGAAGASLILFTGGDGTARDVAAGLAPGVAVLGVPAGVKMYSACFAVSPTAAGALAAEWLARGPLPVGPSEVLDLDESLLRAGRPDPRLFALVPVPSAPGRTQARKAATPAGEAEAVRRAATGLVGQLRPGVRYLLGPGGTLAEVARVLGIPATPLGVDVVEDGRLLVRDASESQVLAAIDGHDASAVVTVIGGQGFLLGRGNQQLSSRVLDALGADPLLVVATEQKLIELGGRPLLVDTGDAAVDARLAGRIRVITGRRSSSIYPVEAAAAAAAPPIVDPSSLVTSHPTTEGASPCV